MYHEGGFSSLARHFSVLVRLPPRARRAREDVRWVTQVRSVIVADTRANVRSRHDGEGGQGDMEGKGGSLARRKGALLDLLLSYVPVYAVRVLRPVANRLSVAPGDGSGGT